MPWWFDSAAADEHKRVHLAPGSTGTLCGLTEENLHSVEQEALTLSFCDNCWATWKAEWRIQ